MSTSRSPSQQRMLKYLAKELAAKSGTNNKDTLLLLEEAFDKFKTPSQKVRKTTAYLEFSNFNKKSNPGMSIGESSKDSGAKWKLMSEADKAVWQQKANERNASVAVPAPAPAAAPAKVEVTPVSLPAEKEKKSTKQVDHKKVQEGVEKARKESENGVVHCFNVSSGRVVKFDPNNVSLVYKKDHNLCGSVKDPELLATALSFFEDDDDDEEDEDFLEESEDEPAPTPSPPPQPKKAAKKPEPAPAPAPVPVSAPAAPAKEKKTKKNN